MVAQQHYLSKNSVWQIGYICDNKLVDLVDHAISMINPLLSIGK